MTSAFISLPFICEHFFWGKILQGRKDISGYQLVAKSNGLTEEDCSAILAQTGAGISQAVLRGKSAYAYFYYDHKVVFSCTQRSPNPEQNSRYYLQSHFLVMDYEVLEDVFFDLAFLAEAIGDIPVFSEELNLPAFEGTYERTDPIQDTIRRVIRQYPPEFLENTYRALKGPYPVAIFDLSSNAFQVLELFQALLLLTPAKERKFITFASMTSGTSQIGYKFKVNPTGALQVPHLVIRLNDAKVVPPEMVNQLPTAGIQAFRESLQVLIEVV